MVASAPVVLDHARPADCDVEPGGVIQVLQPGYRQSTGSSDKVLRAARVAVADPR